MCSNSTAGGWEEIERGFASTGQLGFPIAMHWNKSQLPARLSTWTVPAAAPTDWSNSPVLTQWHNQGWYDANHPCETPPRKNKPLTQTIHPLNP